MRHQQRQGAGGDPRPAGGALCGGEELHGWQQPVFSVCRSFELRGFHGLHVRGGEGKELSGACTVSDVRCRAPAGRCRCPMQPLLAHLLLITCRDPHPRAGRRQHVPVCLQQGVPALGAAGVPSSLAGVEKPIWHCPAAVANPLPCWGSPGRSCCWRVVNPSQHHHCDSCSRRGSGPSGTAACGSAPPASWWPSSAVSRPPCA